MKVLVIGAGPSGLVATKTLLERGYDVHTVELNENIGGTFRYKKYDDGKLVSSKYITAFSDFRFSSDDADHPTMDAYVKYLESYCQKYNLYKYINFQVEVVNIVKNFPFVSKLDNAKSDSSNVKKRYLVRLRNILTNLSSDMEYDAICICSGLHNDRYFPKIPGLESYTGQVLHSADYRDKGIFVGKRVLVVGSGETGLDIVFRAMQATDNVTLVSRSGFLSVPSAIGEHIPLDTLITNLCECSHLHPLVEKYKLKWKFTTPWIRLAFLFGTGSSLGYNQWAGFKKPGDVRRGYQIINKSTDAMPFLNRPVKQNSWLGKFLYSRLDHGPVVDQYPERMAYVKHDIEKIQPNSNTVVFTDGTSQDFDIILLATGYRLNFPFLDETSNATTNAFPPSGHPNEHNIVNTSELTLAYIGFVRPNVGAIPPMSEMQIFYWICRLEGIIGEPTTSPTYWLLGNSPRTGAYGVDYGAYMHDLARAMKCDPRILDLMFRSPKSLIAWAMGQAYISFFRLRGPFFSKDMIPICEKELLFPVLHRPLMVNLMFGGIIALFSTLNGVLYAVSPLLRLCGVTTS